MKQSVKVNNDGNIAAGKLLAKLTDDIKRVDDVTNFPYNNLRVDGVKEERQLFICTALLFYLFQCSRNSVGKRHHVFFGQLQRGEGPSQLSADGDQGRSATSP